MPAVPSMKSIYMYMQLYPVLVICTIPCLVKYQVDVHVRNFSQHVVITVHVHVQLHQQNILLQLIIIIPYVSFADILQYTYFQLLSAMSKTMGMQFTARQIQVSARRVVEQMSINPATPTVICLSCMYTYIISKNVQCYERTVMFMLSQLRHTNQVTCIILPYADL